MIRADTGSLSLYEKPVYQPASVCFWLLFSLKNTAETAGWQAWSWRDGCFFSSS